MFTIWNFSLRPVLYDHVPTWTLLFMFSPGTSSTWLMLLRMSTE